jgi:tripartite ATP-independent transporter DctP family solute receptor
MERTNNRVKVEVYPAGQLFSDKDLVRALPSGAVDMALITDVLLSGLVPTQMLNALPLFYQDFSQVHRMVDSKCGDILRQDIEEKANAKVLYLHDYDSVQIASKMPLRKMEDLKGKRIRGAGETVIEGLRALGAAPTLIGAGEVYLALQRGTVDAGLAGVSTLWDRKYFEVTKYLTMVDFNFGIMPILINKKKFDGLPGDIQKIMLEAAKEVQAWGRKEVEKIISENVELLKKKGMEVYQLPEGERERWREATKVVQDNFLKRVGEEKGKQLLECAQKVR